MGVVVVRHQNTLLVLATHCMLVLLTDRDIHSMLRSFFTAVACSYTHTVLSIAFRTYLLRAL